MENKIQELTEKIYKEGVEKGMAEAEKIISDANIKANKIIEEAEAQAQRTLLAAQKQSEEISEKTKSELQLFASQSVNALKTEISNLLTDKILNVDVNHFLNQKDFLNKFILTIAEKWSPQENIVIYTNDTDSLQNYFAAHAKDILNNGLKIEKIHGRNVVFSIAPSDGSYKINFGAEEFENYFKSFLRPQLLELLFNKE